MRYLGEDSDGSLELLQQHAVVWRVVQAADTVRNVFNGGHVKAWKVQKVSLCCSVKFWSEERLEIAAPQVAAETQAMIKIRRNHKEPHPLLVLPVQRFDSAQGGMFSISPYAGEVVSDLRTGVLADIGFEELMGECLTMAVCVLITQQMLVLEVKEPGTEELVIKQFLHKDIKPSNMCRSGEYGLYRLIDWGAFSSVDKSLWVDVRDLSYVTPEMAYYYEEHGQHAAVFYEGLLAATNNTTDLYMTGLAIMEFFLGRLPRQIDYANYDHDYDFLEAVRHFRWEDYLENVEMPAEMKKWLMKVLAFDPADRFQSADEALNQPWILSGLSPVVVALKAAAKDWAAQVEGIMMDLDAIVRGGDSSNSSKASITGVNSNISTSSNTAGSGSLSDSSHTSGSTHNNCVSIGQDVCSNTKGCGSNSLQPICSQSAATMTAYQPSATSEQVITPTSSEGFSCSTPSLRSTEFSSYQATFSHIDINSSSSSSSKAKDTSIAAAAAASSSSVGSMSTASSLGGDQRVLSCCNNNCEGSTKTAAAGGHCSCCCGAAAAVPAAVVQTVDTQMQTDPETYCGFHVMLLVVKESADKSAAAAGAAESPRHQVISSDEGEKVCPPQQQQQQDAGPSDYTHSVSSPLTSTAMSHCSSNISSTEDSEVNSSTALVQKVKGMKSVKRAVKSHLKRACGFMSCVLKGLQHAAHR